MHGTSNTTYHVIWSFSKVLNYFISSERWIQSARKLRKEFGFFFFFLILGMRQWFWNRRKIWFPSSKLRECRELIFSCQNLPDIYDQKGEQREWRGSGNGRGQGTGGGERGGEEVGNRKGVSKKKCGVWLTKPLHFQAETIPRVFT